MNVGLMENCDLLVKNRDTIEKAFMWDSDLMTLAGSSYYAGMKEEADPEKLKACDKILGDKAGFFSDYNGNARIPLLCKMAAAEDPEQYFDRIRGLVEQMKELKWIDADYKILAALTISDHKEADEFPETVAKMAELFKEMKKNHPWLTDGQDVPLAAILAVSDIDSEKLVTEMETCYKILKERFFDADAVQSLSHTLAANPAAADVKCAKVEEIFDLLKESKHPYGQGSELAVLGTLTMLELPAATIADEIAEADEYLKTKTGFGDFLMGADTRRMYAAIMVMNTHMPAAAGSQEILLDNMLAAAIALEICMLLMMTTLCFSVSSRH